ncbi:MAG: hypothetical protein GX851_00780 [Clostridiales bacterium]|nr:hypothetical protein [Clostridiales bacterium]
MLIEVFTVLIAIWGSVSLLYYLLFKFVSWGTRPGVTVICAHGDGRQALMQLEAVRRTAELTGNRRKQRIVIVDFGVDEDVGETLVRECYGGSNTYFCGADSLADTILSFEHEFVFSEK